MEDILNDKDSLFLLENDNEILAVVSAGDVVEKEEDQEGWSKEIKNPCALARVGVKKEYQGRGYAKQIISYAEKEMKNRGYDGIHFLVSKTNPSALALYNRLGYKMCGESDVFGFDWYLYEKKI